MDYTTANKLKKLFNCFDLDGNGFLNPKELIIGVRRACPSSSVKYAK